MASQQIKIELRYERHNDGRYYVTSDDVPGCFAWPVRTSINS